MGLQRPAVSYRSQSCVDRQRDGRVPTVAPDRLDSRVLGDPALARKIVYEKNAFLRSFIQAPASFVMKSKNLYAITGITGKVGGVVARTLLAANQPVKTIG